MWDRPAPGWSTSVVVVEEVVLVVAARVRRLREVVPTVVPPAGPRDRAVVEEVATNSASATPVVVVVVAAGRHQVGVAAALLPRSVAGPARSGGRSCDVAPHHSGTLPCLRLGNSSRLVASMRRPATSFWRVSAGSITSSM